MRLSRSLARAALNASAVHPSEGFACHSPVREFQKSGANAMPNAGRQVDAKRP